MTDMLETVARAIADSANISPDGLSRTDIAFPVTQAHRNAARAALEALRPGDAGIFASARHFVTVGQVWRAMIDHALGR